jgi:hypothetical protein
MHILGMMFASLLIASKPPCSFSRLQSTSVAIGESFPIPEIVAIGGQSDGKSSLLEAFLGVSMEQSVPLTANKNQSSIVL